MIFHKYEIAVLYKIYLLCFVNKLNPRTYILFGTINFSKKRE